MSGDSIDRIAQFASTLSKRNVTCGAMRMLFFMMNKKNNEGKRIYLTPTNSIHIYSLSCIAFKRLSYSECDVWKKNNGGGKEKSGKKSIQECGAYVLWPSGMTGTCSSAYSHLKNSFERVSNDVLMISEHRFHECS
jgi:hypothetical protein